MRFIYDDKRSLYLYETPAPILRIPEERTVAQFQVIPATLRNSQKLVKLGYPVRDPLLDYDFPGPYRIIEPQRATTRFMVLNPRCFVLNDMRTGKTVSTMHATDFIMKDYAARGIDARTLILSTKSTLYDPWLKHVQQTFDGKRTARMLVGPGERRYKEFRRPADYYIGNYDALRLIASGELPSYIKCVVIDEFTAYKHTGTRRFKQAYACFSQVENLIILSGTPTPERSTDAYGPAKLVHGLNGESFDSFKNRCMYRQGSFRWIERANAKDIAAAALQPSIRYTRAQVIGLPNKLPIRHVSVALSPRQSEVVHALKTKTLNDLQDKTITAVNAAAYRSKFLQAYQGVIYDDDKRAHNLQPIERVKALKELLDECSGRAIVFSGFTGVVQMLTDALAEYNPRFINGSVTAKQRLYIMDDFNSGKCGPIVGDPGTMGHGLDLTGGNTIIWYGPVDRNEHYQQANERIEGLKQKLPTQVVHLYSSKLEQEVFSRLREKQSMQMDILELVA
jgi:Helicase conserved C-terminal domain/SNF2-related domain